MGVDANARIPVEVEGVTGSLAFGLADDLGESLLPFLQQRGLYVPSIFEDIHSGPLHTWRHPRGQLTRIDYVWAKVNVATAMESSWTCETVDHCSKKHLRDAAARPKWPIFAPCTSLLCLQRRTTS